MESVHKSYALTRDDFKALGFHIWLKYSWFVALAGVVVLLSYCGYYRLETFDTLYKPMIVAVCGIVGGAAGFYLSYMRQIDKTFASNPALRQEETYIFTRHGIAGSTTPSASDVTWNSVRDVKTTKTHRFFFVSKTLPILCLKDFLPMQNGFKSMPSPGKPSLLSWESQSLRLGNLR